MIEVTYMDGSKGYVALNEILAFDQEEGHTAMVLRDVERSPVSVKEKARDLARDYERLTR